MLILTALLAHADVPPPGRYVETCTVAIQCGDDIPGTTCGAWHGGREDCEALEAKGWQQMCKTWGASTWDEVFCETTPDEEARQDRISAATGVVGRVTTLPARRCGCASAGAGVGFALLPLVLLALRRRAA